MYTENYVKKDFFSLNLWHKRDMSAAKVFLFHSELELPESLNIGHSFDISNSTSEFNDAYLKDISVNAN